METRREFIKNGLKLGVGGAGLLTAGQALAFPEARGNRWAMIIDSARCSGCQACMVACKLQNNTAQGRFNTRVTETETGEYPRAAIVYTATLCRHCSNPPCVEACSQNAAFVHGSGLVMTDWNRCTADGDCIQACPHGARFADPRFGNRSDKCDLCLHRIARGMVPACVENCPSNARIFGRVDEPQGEFADYLSRFESLDWDGAVKILEPNTGPKKKEVKS